MPDDVRSSAELEATLGEQLRALRLRRGLTQRQLAERAGLSLTAVGHAESGQGATLSTFVRLLKALGRSDWLATLSPAVSISPLQMLRSPKPRQRAYAPRRRRSGDVQAD
jgi:transcriptional regulator with XRE-family HTH domain